MRKYFALELPSGCASVVAPPLHLTHSEEELKNIFDIVFNTIGAKWVTVGLGVSDNRYSEKGHLTVDQYHQYGDVFAHNYSEYYIVTGCKLADIKQAHALVSVLEKQLIWKTLCTQRTSSQKLTFAQ
jgi:hypothetical protein